MTKFYLVRHGETDWNLEGRFQGIEDIPLNETGLRQAEACGEGLKKSFIPFDCVVTSPLQRAGVTAKTIAEWIGIPEIYTDNRLIERDFGRVSGRKREVREQMLASGEDLMMEEESAVAERMQQVLTEFSGKGYHHVLLVSHGASIRALLSGYSTPGSAPATAVQRNTCLTTVVFDGSQFYLEAFDQTPEELEA